MSTAAVVSHRYAEPSATCPGAHFISAGSVTLDENLPVFSTLANSIGKKITRRLGNTLIYHQMPNVTVLFELYKSFIAPFF